MTVGGPPTAMIMRNPNGDHGLLSRRLHLMPPLFPVSLEAGQRIKTPYYVREEREKSPPNRRRIRSGVKSRFAHFFPRCAPDLSAHWESSTNVVILTGVRYHLLQCMALSGGRSPAGTSQPLLRRKHTHYGKEVDFSEENFDTRFP